jgi:hypothetical protein
LEAGRQRYRLLETLRQYAQSRLHESGEETQFRARHLAFFVALAEEAAPALYGPAQDEWVARLDFERENLLAAHEWCDRVEGGVELGLRLVTSIFRYWMHRGPLELGLRVTRDSLGRVGAHEYGIAWCKALLTAGDLNKLMGCEGEAYTYYQKSLFVAGETGDKRSRAHALWRLGAVCGMPGGLATQRRYAEEAVALARELGDEFLLGFSVAALGTILVAAEELDLAEPLYAEAAMLWRESGDRAGIAQALLNVVVLSLRRGSPQGARKPMLEALAMGKETSSKRLELFVLATAAQLATYLCDWARAARLYGACVAHAEETGLQIELEGPDAARPERAREALGSAAFAAAADEGLLLGSKNAMAEARAWLEKLTPPAQAA